MLHDLYGLDHPNMWHVPFQLLQERELHENISHREMPTWDEHRAFALSNPYHSWYWFEGLEGLAGGCIYLSKQREIGVGVLRAHRGNGFAKQAIAELMRLHPGRFLANVAPGNGPSHRLFESLNFKPLQVTYVLE